MSVLTRIEHSIEHLLSERPYALPPEQQHGRLLALLKQELAYACDLNPQLNNYVEGWPADFRFVDRIADLPFMPVGAFKRDPPLSLVPTGAIKRTLSSSSTSGQQPSRVVLDATTSRRMTKGIANIIRDFIGSARRPYLVIDTPENLVPSAQLSARGAAIQSLSPFATTTTCCLRSQNGALSVDLKVLFDFAEQWGKADVLVYGFTYVIWTHFVRALKSQSVTFNMPNVHVLHSGGWKRLQDQAITKDGFAHEVATVFGCPANRVIDYYGMIESVGVVYPDCEFGNKHVPAFGDVIVRDPLTLAPVQAGEQGLLQICSVLPTSFPGFTVLTDDIGQIIGYDGCSCGRRGTYFRFVQRAPKAEARGCGNLQSTRQHLEGEPRPHGSHPRSS